MVIPYATPWRALALGVAIGVTTLVATRFLFDDSALQMATRWTGRLSALLFIPVLAARPAVDLFGARMFGALLRQRAGIGLALAGNHHVHMVLLTIYLLGEGAQAPDFYLNPGLYIYIVLVGMNVTSFPNAARALPPSVIRWLHLVGIYALALAFFTTVIFSQLTDDASNVFRVAYGVLFALCFGLRVAARLK